MFSLKRLFAVDGNWEEDALCCDLTFSDLPISSVALEVESLFSG